MTQTHSNWRIHPAEPADADALALVGAATFLETFAGILDGAAILAHCAGVHTAERYAAYLHGGARAWLATAEQGGAPIGYALMTVPDLPGGDAATDLELKRIYGLSRFHGSGLGQALMEAAVAAAAGAGAVRLLLGVYRGNARALGFYRKHGFEVIGERQFRVGARDYDDWVLAKPLA